MTEPEDFGDWSPQRHIVRLGLFAVVAHIIAVRFIDVPADRAELFPALVKNPLYLGIIAGAIILTHWVLTRDGLRDRWHERLEAIGLRKG